jgi:hypothetical protein
MKSIFSLGVQSYNPFSVRHPSLGQWSNVVSASIQ